MQPRQAFPNAAACQLLDEIVITGLRTFAHHGVFEQERRDGQEFIVDAVMRLSLADAATTDDLTRTVHYGIVSEAIVAAVERDPVDLIETVAERVADVILQHPAVVEATVTIHKPDAPISAPFSDVMVRIHRTRQQRYASVQLELPEAWDESEATRAIIALGANLGERESTLRTAVSELAAAPGVRVRAASPIVETPALRLDGIDESAPAYLNAVVAVDTVLSPRALLAALHRIEDANGRTREVRWGDRTLDLDLVAYGSATVFDQDLVVPHPRAHERAFVLDPWHRMDPQAELVGHGSVAELLDRVIEAARQAGTAEKVEIYPSAPLLPTPESRAAL